MQGVAGMSIQSDHDATENSGDTKQIPKGSLRIAAEARLALMPKQRPSEEYQHELQVYQIELEMQIEELQQAQSVLEASRDCYLDLYEFAPVGYITLNRHGMISGVNHTGSTLLGAERKKLLNLRFSRFIAPEDCDQWDHHFLGVLTRDGRQSCELQIRRLDGTHFHSQITSLRADDSLSSHKLDDPLFQNEIRNTSTLLRLVITDITVRKQKELEMQKFLSIVNSTDDAIIGKTLDGKIQSWNESAERVFGYTETEVIGKPIQMLIPSNLQNEESEILLRIARGERVKHFETVRHRKDGSLVIISSTISPVFDAQGKVIGVSNIVRDITERKRLEREILDRRNEMEFLQKKHVVAQTAAAIAHEINQPLLAIASYSQAALILLNAENPNLDQARKAIEGSEQQAMRAGRSLRKLFDSLGDEEFSTEVFDLNKEILSSLDTARLEYELQFVPVLRLEEGLPLIRANRIHVQKVLLNLLQNGIDAMRGIGMQLPAITVSVRTMKNESVAQVTIQDNGPGVKKENLQRLFEPFFTTKATGIGMGLAISRSLIEGNGGRLWIDPQEGSGATFHLTLPFAA